MNFKEIADLIGGKFLKGEAQSSLSNILTISIDSRNIMDVNSCLFIAIKGVRHDGHQYLKDLYNHGVRAFLICEETSDISQFKGASVFLVNNTLKSLQRLSAAVRRKYTYPVAGITGSNGKTIIKEWLFDLLQKDKRVLRSPRSYNSQVGVPLSVWNMSENYDLAIFEAGISQKGEMEKLSTVIAPTIGLITNIGEAHQKNFKTKEEKTDEKLLLFESCKIILYRCDYELIYKRIQKKYGNSGKQLFSWTLSNDKKADLNIQSEILSGSTVLSFIFNGEPRSIEIPFTDEASIENVCHCLAFIIATGNCNKNVLSRFKYLQPVAMRLEIKDGINNCTLIDDYYNSDINSLKIALQYLNHQNTKNNQKQVLILSDICQSGMVPEKIVKELSNMVNLYKIDSFIGIGPVLSDFSEYFSVNSSFYRNTDEFIRVFDSSIFKDKYILIKGARKFHFEKISSLLQMKYHRTLLEVNLNALVNNLNEYRALLTPETKILVLVKASSYGHGAIEVARTLQYHKVDYLAVAVADEGIDLRQNGIDTPILVMNPEEHSFEMMIEYGLEPNIYSFDVYNKFEKTARRMAVSKYPVHLKLDTGMHRLGFSSELEVRDICRLADSSDYLYVRSVFSHFAVADDPSEDDYTRSQIKLFKKLSDIVISTQHHPVIRHLLNTVGIERFPEYQMEMVRLGIGIYGIAQSSKIHPIKVARWKTVISQVKRLVAGETVGYGRNGKVTRPSDIAVIPVGYADGYDRRLGNGTGKVWINGAFAPVIGNICMDMTMIDVTGICVKPGDSVELMGDHVKVEEMARIMGTISYEILTGISQRVKRVYVEE
ncbi:MAG: bifunctional UDP-N-acetylmuramoyl-tripeptide:D-alanyl-D-alanine ligase/alanine racemase [Prolixibacteraceae bacterium]|nr:bifunctional UDP-N-acetylmuramoyl-tripeptide:D-alanyl-D-alanine ligase/alanine racemase [Prolixibacteraceae bacterium]